MHSLLSLLLTGLLAMDAVYGVAVSIPEWSTRHRSRSVSMAGLKLVKGDVNPTSYIVKMAKPASRGAHIAWVNGLVKASPVSDATTVRTFDPDFFNGYSAQLDEAAVNKLLASKDVEWVEEDAIMHIQATQINATWGLQRLTMNQDDFPAGANPGSLNFTYLADDNGGAGVDVYVIDTGIRTTHREYEGRASMGFRTRGLNNTDDNGHGSHVSGIIGGVTFGVAKKANIIGVKVMDAEGRGPTTDILEGIDFVVRAAKASGRPSVINMSIGGEGSAALDNAAAGAVDAGIYVVASAGNDGIDAFGNSPARASGVITVGAMNIKGEVSDFSNFGAAVNIFAPGEDIISCAISSDKAAASLSGTSMASPYVAGLVALFLSVDPTTTPAQMPALLRGRSFQGVLSKLPARSPNSVLFNPLPLIH